MLPIEVAAVLLLAVCGTGSLLLLVVYPHWEKKFMTEARKGEIEAKGQRRPRSIVFTAWDVASRIILLGLPVLFIVDGLIFRMGLLYSPRLSFFNPLDSYMQIAGLVLASVGLVIMVTAGRTVSEHVYARASGERKLVTTGIFAHIRHPLYLAFILLPIGLILITLNYVALLLPLLFWTSTDSDLEERGYERRLTFLTTCIELEEQELLKRFGKDYEEYMKRTGKLLPRIRR